MTHFSRNAICPQQPYLSVCIMAYTRWMITKKNGYPEPLGYELWSPYMWSTSHCTKVIMSLVASQITSVSIVCSPVQAQVNKTIKPPRHWPLFLHKRQVTREMFSFDDVIMHGSVLICTFNVSINVEKIAHPHTFDHKSDHVTNPRTILRRILNLKKVTNLQVIIVQSSWGWR